LETATAIAACMSSPTQGWGSAPMSETRLRRALNKTEVTEILTGRFLADGGSGAGHVMVGGGFQGLTGDAN
jgi:hypothetical protein